MNENLQNFLEKYYKKEESTIKTIEEKILKQKEREILFDILRNIKNKIMAIKKLNNILKIPNI